MDPPNRIDGGADADATLKIVMILTSVFIVSLGIGVGTLSRKRRKTYHRRGADGTIPMTTVFGDSAYGDSAEDEADGSCFNLNRFVGACCGKSSSCSLLFRSVLDLN
jgi:hypothetical protein